MQAVGLDPRRKAVSIGDGVEAASRFGLEVHDEIFVAEERRFHRPTIAPRGIEGGITTGVSAGDGGMKLLSTPRARRSSTCAPTPRGRRFERPTPRRSRAGVIGRRWSRSVLADAMIEKFGGDTLEEMRRNLAIAEQIALY
jgi:chorismate synthase